MKRATLIGELCAEFLGTFIILFFGCSVVVQIIAYDGEQGNYTSAPFAWGLAVAMAIYLAGGVSNAHINPAVTFAFALRRGFAWRKVPSYWTAQTAGAFTGAALTWWNYHEVLAKFDPAKGFDTQKVFSTSPQIVGLWGAFRDEVLLTAILIMLVFALIDKRNKAPLANVGPLLVGLLIVAIGFSFGSNSGWAINPARDFGPRLLSWLAGWTQAWHEPGGQLYFWVPIIAPLIGAAIGAYVYDHAIGRFLHGEPEPVEVDDAPATDTEPPSPDAGQSNDPVNTHPDGKLMINTPGS